MAGLNTRQRQLRAACVRVTKTAGVCATVNGSEVGRAGRRDRAQRPHAMVVLGPGQGAPDASTLNMTAWRQLVRIRLETPLPLTGDYVEESRLEDTFADAVATLVDAFHAEIDLIDNDLIEFDPLGGTGGVVAQMTTGYVDRDQTKMRVAELSLPFVLYDLHTQER